MNIRIAIVGKKAETANYVKYVQKAGAIPVVTLSLGEVARCHALLLPGGGDITPAFFGEKNHGSRNIDTELDIIQLQTLDLAVHKRMPILGICKGMQIINVGFGGTITQDLKTAALHKYDGGDQYHITMIQNSSPLHRLYGDSCIVNSAHHQGLNRLGAGLQAIQHCPLDHCVEAISHRFYPILGLQWHPERIDREIAKIDGTKIMSYFFSLISAGQSS